MRVPFFRSPWQEPEASVRVITAWSRVLGSGNYILGPSVQRFETALAQRLGLGGVVGVNSGTDALVLALRLLNLEPCDEVVLPGYTFFACFEAVVRVGAVPVLCDCATDDFIAGAQQVAARLTPRTRAVLAVPLFGDASALPGIAALCRERGIPMVEDAAQALGARAWSETRGWVPAGAWGDLGTMSFYPTKTLGATGDAGALGSPHADLINRARSLRNHGLQGLAHADVGLNSRMDALQAEVLQIGLEQLDTWLAGRQTIARRYLTGLSGLPDIVLPADREGHAWNYFVLRCAQRDDLQARLAAAGVDTKIYYERPIHEQPAWLARFGAMDLPIASSNARQSLALPIFPGMQDVEVERVIAAVRQAVEGQQNEKGDEP
ncbi:DegT/DnrJ/EryC1/StrS family aminotransferase [Hydrogenophaga sp. RWCD_12]|uniref:DegT/DnrJ/EryC1/StrS family aminotransferase n=1 Tax=Hydrogenophaga sp. RWCD_12 TaxID=3391190 RepID=UPI00398464E5